MAEFSRHGYSGGRVDRIASEARTNKQSIYRYFGNKRNLFLAALDEGLLSPLEQPPPKGSALEELEHVIGGLMDLCYGRPEVTRLLMWEMLEGHEVRRKRRYEIFHRRRNAIERGIREGIFSPGLDVEQVLADISALCIYPFVMEPSYRILRNRSPYDPAEFRRRKRHVLDAVRRLLAPYLMSGGGDGAQTVEIAAVSGWRRHTSTNRRGAGTRARDSTHAAGPKRTRA